MRDPSPHAVFAGADGKVVIAHTNEDGIVTSVSLISPYVVDSHIAQSGGQILMPSEHGKVDRKKKLRLHGGILSVAAPTDADLTMRRRAACTTIDQQAEKARGRFVTPGSGQQHEYAATLADARAVLNGTGSEHPWVVAEQQAQAAVGTVMSLAQLANQIVGRASVCDAALIKIRQVRRTAKIAVSSAGSSDAIQAIVSALSWPTA